jgi:WD40 repeat protein
MVRGPCRGATAFQGSNKDETLKLWELATGRQLRSFPGHMDLVTSVAFSPTGNSRFREPGSKVFRKTGSKG